jgi:hypothetical protein
MCGQDHGQHLEEGNAMNMRRPGSIVLVLGWMLAPAPTASAQPSVAGKTTQATYECRSFDVDGKAVVTLTIPQGKKKRVLIVNAYAKGIGPGPDCALTMNLDVGIATDQIGGSTNGMQGVIGTAVGTWWADVDALETANPGGFIGVPIVVTMNVFKASGDACSGTCVALALQNVKK